MMELRDRDGDLLANIAKANNVYPVRLNVIPPKAGFAACTLCEANPGYRICYSRDRDLPSLAIDLTNNKVIKIMVLTRVTRRTRKGGGRVK